MYGMEHGGWMVGGGFTMLLWWLVPLGLVAAIAAYVLRTSGRRATERGAIDMLKERYARGEIGSEEFEQTKRKLDR